MDSLLQSRSRPNYKNDWDHQINPGDREIIMCVLNPREFPPIGLPPCHALWQFYVVSQELSNQPYQRSGDTDLGVFLDITSDRSPTSWACSQCYCHPLEDAHFPLHHIKLLKIQLQQEPRLSLSSKSFEKLKQLMTSELKNFGSKGLIQPSD